jgi:hypothetical protein
MLLAFIPVLLYLSIFFKSTNNEVIEFLLFSNVLGNIILTLTSLPFILMFLSRYHHRRQYDYAHITGIKSFILPASLAILSVTGFVVALTYQPYGPYSAQKQPLLVTIDESNEFRSQVRFLSPEPIGTSTFMVNGQAFPLVDAGRSVLIDTEPSITFNLSSKQRPLFNRTERLIQLTLNENATNINLTLISSNTLGIIDANYPTVNQDNNRIQIFVGRNPPNPLNLRLVSESTDAFQLVVNASFNNNQLSSTSDNFILSSRHLASATFNIGN